MKQNDNFQINNNMYNLDYTKGTSFEIKENNSPFTIQSALPLSESKTYIIEVKKERTMRMNNCEKFKKIVEELTSLYEKKNDNYGNSFDKLYEELGAIAGLVPLYNKLHRATNLIKGGKNDFESLEDTFKDLANYSIMNLIALQNSSNEEKIKVIKTLNENIINSEE